MGFGGDIWIKDGQLSMAAPRKTHKPLYGTKEVSTQHDKLGVIAVCI